MTRRKFLSLFNTVCLALFWAAAPVSFDFSQGIFPRPEPLLAMAKGGDDDGGGNSGSGSDNSGSGGGRDDDDDDDDDNDDDDDDDVNSSNGSGKNQKGRSSSSGKRLGAKYNLTIQHTNGWRESVRNGRYQLLDPKGRKVANRVARMEDFVRMRAALGN